MSISAFWVCGEFHVFEYGQEAWHLEHMQGLVNGHPVPTLCQADDENGDSCLDSSHLWGPFDDQRAAQLFAFLRKSGSNVKVNFESPDTDPLAATPTKLYTVNLERRVLNSFRAGVIDRHPEIFD